jgi:hypothetical protein
VELVVLAPAGPIRRCPLATVLPPGEPAWIGMPFFYWYQLLWVIVGAALTAIVYFATDE